MTTSTTREFNLLNLLRNGSGGWISGAELSRQLGISRAAVWKQIEQLRQEGFRIEAQKSKGYRLLAMPEELTEAALTMGQVLPIVGRRVITLGKTDSTNLQAATLGAEGEAEGTVVFADSQSAGKGRRGRTWCSPPGTNLYLSLLLRPAIAPWDAPQLTFLSAVAAARALRNVSRLPITVKWPNDLLVNGRKVAGMLNEMQAESEQVGWVVLGIGINVNMRREQFPEDLRYPATSLALEVGEDVSRLAIARELLAELDRAYAVYLRDGFAPIRSAWLELFPFVDRLVEISGAGETVSGRVTGVDGDGALLLVDDRGKELRILSGDVRPL
ncbi:MAG: biotin--[acetyl-CoA-carboxylase] ligase [Desulfuromonas sp.]|nr:MAG: biotin--[acetyl-CoA-carboxylase] ligase [Desulfuromonas sp.]